MWIAIECYQTKKKQEEEKLVADNYTLPIQTNAHLHSWKW